jgi:hypothetical protein
MELGTYTGVLLAMVTFQFFASDKPAGVWFASLAFVFFALLFFFFLGGYGAGVTAGYVGLLLLGLSKNGVLASRRLIVSALISSASLLAYFLAVRFVDSSATGVGPTLLIEKISQDPLFVLKFLLAGPSSGLVSTQTFEIFGPTTLEVFALSLGIIVCVLFALTLLRTRMNLVNLPAFPSFLIIYALGTAFMLLLYRPYETYQLVNGWYSLHFKLLLVGVLFVFYVVLQNTETHLNLKRALMIFTSGILVILLLSNVLQIRRQDSERVYFQNVAKVALFPQMLERDNNGFSQLVIPFDGSTQAIEVLKRNRLSVFRDPAQSLKGLASPEGLVILGESWPDGWVGKDIQLVGINDNCLEMELAVTPFGAASNTSISIGGSREALSLGGTTNLRIAVPVFASGKQLAIKFANSKSPADAGINNDTRELSASIKVRCITSD